MLLVSITWILKAFAAHPPYPIIFVHGLAGGDETFEEALHYLTGEGSNINWGDSVNVFDVVLNADNNEIHATLEFDVKWEDFQCGDRWIDVGRRNFAPGTNPDDGAYVHAWGNSSIYAVNFKEERIEGAYDPINDYFDYSNSSAIYKQGYALQKVIEEVLQHTAADKVILVGHSMGGLAIREYLQRIEGNSHCWWVDPDDIENGHKVAKVVTIGTPHLGSNLLNVARDDTTSREVWPPNPWSEASRDLRYGYVAWGWDPDPVEDVGVYLFGGSEYQLYMDDVADGAPYYFNHDINCDGDYNDDIEGVNSGSASGICNPFMPLPSNIDYTWITSDNGWFGDGDGVVRRSRQFLASPGDTLLIHEDHGDEPDAVAAIVRGLDEPETQDLAYGIALNRYYQGCITYQSNQQPWDNDAYNFSVSSEGIYTISVSGYESGVQYLSVTNDDGYGVYESITEIPFALELDLEPGEYCAEFLGQANSVSWQIPYTFSIHRSETTTPPQPVDDLAIEIQNNRVRLSWTEPECPNSGDFTLGAYSVFFNPEPFFEPEGGQLLGTINQTYLYHLVDFSDSERFFYRVVVEGYCVTETPPNNMTLIPDGTFMMGEDDGWPAESPEHQVTLAHDFYLGTSEVTNQEYLEAVQWAYDHGLVTATSSTVQAHGQELLNLDDLDCEISFSGGVFSLAIRSHIYDNDFFGDYGPGVAYPGGYNPAVHPVKEVSWYGAACYCDWRSLMEGVGAFYNGEWDQTPDHNPYTTLAYRLPTEAEWEYAAQYNDDRNYPWGDSGGGCSYANYYGCVRWSAPVGSIPLGNSALGLVDMAGNIEEWTGEWWGDYSGESQVDPLGPLTGSERVHRGGSWTPFNVLGTRCAHRYSDPPSSSSFFTGFRVCRTVNP